MKTKFISLVTVLIFGTLMTFSQVKTINIKVSGNCGMCKIKIDKAAKSVKGVKSASWDKTTKVLELKYDKSVTSTKEVEKAIAAVGYDTPHVKTSDKAYNNLHSCCKYKRSKKSYDHSGCTHAK